MGNTNPAASLQGAKASGKPGGSADDGLEAKRAALRDKLASKFKKDLLDSQ